MKYTALTIGPIYKTFQQAKKTRELWAASYLFSYLMKNIILALKEADKELDIIIPFADDRLLNGKNEAGLFPDRLAFNTKLSIEKIQAVINTEVDKLSKKIAEHIGDDNAKEYFKNYFQVYITEKDFDSNTEKHKVVKTLFDILDLLELQQKFIPEEKQSYLKKFLTKASFKNGKKHSFLIQDAKDIENTENVRFQSLIEISASEIIENLPEDKKAEFEKILKNSFEDNNTDDTNIIDFFKKLDEKKDEKDKSFKTYHKYIAVLQMDGDNFGKINKQLNDGDFQTFSENLAKYSLEVKNIITKYGGLPVYIGGDDVLAFVPVRNGEKNIFTLLKEIDDALKNNFPGFADKIYKDGDEEFKLSLSAGISITYYKYPLNEALQLSHDLLQEKAKKYKGKNAVAYKVIKHSGQSFETVFGKSEDDYKQFKNLVKLHIDESQFFSSVIQHFFENFDLLNMIGKDKDRLKAYRKNFFNESFHGDKETFLNELETYIKQLFDSPDSPDTIKKKLYASLRTVKFLNRDDNE